MIKQRQNLLRKNVISEVTNKRQLSNNSLILGSIIATFIAITPYLFYLYKGIPETQVWDTFLFTYDSKSWGDANFAMWVLTNKAIPFSFLLIWFLTCRHWWYHALLVPMAMYIYQIVGIFNDNIGAIDEFELFHLIPVMAIVIPSIYLIRAKMFNKMNDADKSLQDLEDEFRISPKGFWAKFKQYF
ncbi:hypothetical protein A9Q87_09315 [Flavobacteriales bacterium 34_180_T64]|nr:hypothetical protein A9Q87_09315 [Flavobacteriales bacterium 34_180_T64]